MKTRWKIAIRVQAIVGLLIGGPEFVRISFIGQRASLAAVEAEKARKAAGLPLSDWAQTAIRDAS